ncbi:MAG: flagellar filament capping protein FliD [candidate division Zixibacteria bacterium]|nr:flagellar filament capping protein FliD [candidate division Zixibacteria bacterium]
MGGSIEGIISGFNTSELIDAIIKAESRSLDLVALRQTEQTNQLTTWKSIEALLVGVKAQASLLSSESLWYAKSATSSDESVISVSSTTDASPGSYFLTVDQLASHHQVASQGISSLSENLGTGTFQIQSGNGITTTITVDGSNNTLNSLKDAINNSDAEVTAAVINDGSEHNPYRLILTAKESGAASQITVTPNLTGGTSPVFVPQFDLAEKLSWSDTASANPVLSINAAYTGDENKTYTFTVGGTGTQTIGAGDIDIDWTDGTNSGTITVSTADTDIALTGDGSDGLITYFSAGTLEAGDTFQIQAFDPDIQDGQDAIVRLGGSDNGGSPILLHSATNTITDLIEGVTLELNSVSENNETVQIEISEDRSQIKAQINQFVAKYNEYQSFVDDQFSFNPEADASAGVLMGDTGLMLLHNNIRTTLTSSISGLPEEMRMLSQAGVKFNSQGNLSFDESVFDEQIEDNFTNLMNLFKSSGTTDNNKIEYVSSGASTKISETGYEVDITQAATKGTFTGGSIDNPSVTPLVLNATNNTIKVKINNLVSSDILLTQKTYNSGEELAEEIEEKINSDPNLVGTGVEVTWVDSGNTGHLVISSNSYGDTSTVSLESAPGNSAHSILGLAGGVEVAGLDVEGTINGETATGTGQLLTGDNGNENTAGLQLMITLETADLIEGSEGKVLFNKGIADVMEEKFISYTDPYEGALKSRKDALESQIKISNDRMKFLGEQLERRRADLFLQFAAMEDAMAQMQTEQQYLTSSLAGLNQNWVMGSNQ